MLKIIAAVNPTIQKAILSRNSDVQPTLKVDHTLFGMIQRERSHLVVAIVSKEDNLEVIGNDQYKIKGISLENYIRNYLIEKDLGSPSIIESANINLQGVEGLRLGDPVGSMASGFLVSPEYVLTLNHCVQNKRREDIELRELAVTTHYNETYDITQNLSGEHVYEVIEKITVGDPIRIGIHDEQVVLLKLNRETPSLTLPLRGFSPEETLSTSCEIYMIGHAVGQSKKLAKGGRVLIPEKNKFSAAISAFVGNSGSPIFDRDHKVIGLLAGGGEDFELDDDDEIKFKHLTSKQNEHEFNHEKCLLLTEKSIAEINNITKRIPLIINRGLRASSQKEFIDKFYSGFLKEISIDWNQFAKIQKWINSLKSQDFCIVEVPYFGNESERVVTSLLLANRLSRQRNFDKNTLLSTEGVFSKCANSLRADIIVIDPINELYTTYYSGHNSVFNLTELYAVDTRVQYQLMTRQKSLIQTFEVKEISNHNDILELQESKGSKVSKGAKIKINKKGKKVTLFKPGPNEINIISVERKLDSAAINRNAICILMLRSGDISHWAVVARKSDTLSHSFIEFYKKWHEEESKKTLSPDFQRSLQVINQKIFQKQACKQSGSLIVRSLVPQNIKLNLDTLNRYLIQSRVLLPQRNIHYCFAKHYLDPNISIWVSTFIELLTNSLPDFFQCDTLSKDTKEKGLYSIDKSGDAVQLQVSPNFINKFQSEESITFIFINPDFMELLNSGYSTDQGKLDVLIEYLPELQHKKIFLIEQESVQWLKKSQSFDQKYNKKTTEKSSNKKNNLIKHSLNDAATRILEMLKTKEETLDYQTVLIQLFPEQSKVIESIFEGTFQEKQNGKDLIEANNEDKKILDAIENVTKLEELLNEQDINSGFSSKSGKTIPHYAVIKNQPKILRECIVEGISTSNKDQDGYTPLYYAFKGRSMDVLSELLHRRDSNLNLLKTINQEFADIPESTVMHHEIYSKYLAIANRLLSQEVTVLFDISSTQRFRCIFVPNNNSQTELTSYLLEGEEDEATSLLHWAAFYGYTTIIQKLCVCPHYNANPAFLNKANSIGMSAVHLAASMDHDEVVSKLINAGAAWHQPTLSGVNPKGLAVRYQSKKVIAYLSELENSSTEIQAYFQKHGVNIERFSALSKFAEFCETEVLTKILKELLEKWDNLEPIEKAYIAFYKDSFRKNIAHFMAQIPLTEYSQLKDVIDELLETNPCLIKEKDKYGNAPIHIAVLRQNSSYINFLVKLDSEMTLLGDKYGRTGKDLGELYSCSESVMGLLVSEGHPKQSRRKSSTQVHVKQLTSAIRENKNSDIKVLCELLASVDAYGFAPIHYAVAITQSKEILDTLYKLYSDTLYTLPSEEQYLIELADWSRYNNNLEGNKLVFKSKRSTQGDDPKSAAIATIVANYNNMSPENIVNTLIETLNHPCVEKDQYLGSLHIHLGYYMLFNALCKIYDKNRIYEVSALKGSGFLFNFVEMTKAYCDHNFENVETYYLELCKEDLPFEQEIEMTLFMANTYYQFGKYNSSLELYKTLFSATQKKHFRIVQNYASHVYSEGLIKSNKEENSGGNSRVRHFNKAVDILSNALQRYDSNKDENDTIFSQVAVSWHRMLRTMLFVNYQNSEISNHYKRQCKEDLNHILKSSELEFTKIWFLPLDEDCPDEAMKCLVRCLGKRQFELKDVAFKLLLIVDPSEEHFEQYYDYVKESKEFQARILYILACIENNRSTKISLELLDKVVTLTEPERKFKECIKFIKFSDSKKFYETEVPKKFEETITALDVYPRHLLDFEDRVLEHVRRNPSGSLRSAIDAGDLAVVKCLYELDHPQISWTERNSGTTPLGQARLHGYSEIEQFLLKVVGVPDEELPKEMGPDVTNSDKQSGFSQKELRQFLTDIKYLNAKLESDPDSILNWRSLSKDSLLLIASAQGRYDVVEMLINSGANVNETNSEKELPIHWVIWNTPVCASEESSYIKTLDLLLSKGADVKAQNLFGQNALHCAGRSGNVIVLEKILAEFKTRKKDFVLSKDSRGWTPAHYAVQHRNYNVLNLLFSVVGPSIFETRDHFDRNIVFIFENKDKVKPNESPLLVRTISNISYQELPFSICNSPRINEATSQLLQREKYKVFVHGEKGAAKRFITSKIVSGVEFKISNNDSLEDKFSIVWKISIDSHGTAFSGYLKLAEELGLKVIGLSLTALVELVYQRIEETGRRALFILEKVSDLTMDTEKWKTLLGIYLCGGAPSLISFIVCGKMTEETSTNLGFNDYIDCNVLQGQLISTKNQENCSIWKTVRYKKILSSNSTQSENITCASDTRVFLHIFNLFEEQQNVKGFLNKLSYFRSLPIPKTLWKSYLNISETTLEKMKQWYLVGFDGDMIWVFSDVADYLKSGSQVQTEDLQEVLDDICDRLLGLIKSGFKSPSSNFSLVEFAYIFSHTISFLEDYLKICSKNNVYINKKICDLLFFSSIYSVKTENAGFTKSLLKNYEELCGKSQRFEENGDHIEFKRRCELEKCRCLLAEQDFRAAHFMAGNLVQETSKYIQSVASLIVEKANPFKGELPNLKNITKSIDTLTELSLEDQRNELNLQRIFYIEADLAYAHIIRGVQYFTFGNLLAAEADFHKSGEIFKKRGFKHHPDFSLAKLYLAYSALLKSQNGFMSDSRDSELARARRLIYEARQILGNLTSTAHHYYPTLLLCEGKCSLDPGANPDLKKSLRVQGLDKLIMSIKEYVLAYPTENNKNFIEDLRQIQAKNLENWLLELSDASKMTDGCFPGKSRLEVMMEGIPFVVRSCLEVIKGHIYLGNLEFAKKWWEVVGNDTSEILGFQRQFTKAAIRFAEIKQNKVSLSSSEMDLYFNELSQAIDLFKSTINPDRSMIDRELTLNLFYYWDCDTFKYLKNHYEELSIVGKGQMDSLQKNITSIDEGGNHYVVY